jgi:hypothetical protein
MNASFSYQKGNVEIEWQIKFSFFVLIFMWDSSENYIYCHRKTPNNFRHDKKKKKKKQTKSTGNGYPSNLATK